MNKRYQVFVSSTYEDLQEERKEVMQALLELDCIPAGMELFPASNDDQWTLIKRVIDDCDYYLLIIGGRYGSTNEEGISYTQMEFEYALTTKKPIISFLPKDVDTIPSGKCDHDPQKLQKLEEFKNLAKKKLIKYWTNPENLGSVVSRSMVRLIKDFPAEGWVKAKDAVDASSMLEITKLQKENALLRAQLEKIDTSAPAGADTLAQGEDTVSFTIGFQYDNGLDREHYSVEVNDTWNNIFSYMAPYMVDECSETKLRSAMNSYPYKFLPDLAKKSKFRSINRTNTQSMATAAKSFNLFLIQFRALGLIKISDKKKTVSDTHTYWSLTKYGDFIMTQNLAIKKE